MVLGGLFIFLVATGPGLLFLVERRLPWGISRRLQRGRKSITRRLSYARGAWNPAQRLGRGNALPSEPGWAIYTLTDDGLVHLEYVHQDGRREEFVGPPVDPPAGRARSRRIALVPTVVYLLCAGGGFAVGFTSGGETAPHVQYGVLGLVAGYVISWFGLTVALGILHVRLHRRSAGPEQT